MSEQEAVPPAKPRTRDVPAAAFFDVDNTLIHGSSLFLFGRGAVREGMFTKRELLRFAYKQFRFKRVGENSNHLRSFQEQALRIIDGRDARGLESVVEKVCAKYIVPRLWQDGLALIADEQARGRDVWLITATPIQIAGEIAREVGATGALATIPEQIDGVLTGELVGPVMHAEAKTVAARELAAERGYDLTESSAYSDSINDVTLLELVGHPVATNPDAKLRAVALERKWAIARFSKKRRGAKH